VRNAGYDGIELFQSPATLKTDVRGLGTLLEASRESPLELTGITFGGLRERHQFCLEWKDEFPGKSIPYIYVDEAWSSQLQQIVDDAIPVAIHPHMFKPVQTLAEGETLLNRCIEDSKSEREELRISLMPDTAHSYVAGDRLHDVLKRCLSASGNQPAVKNESPAVRSIHVKDWIPEYGRSYQFYSRGFVPLGKGDVPLVGILSLLKKLQYDGWVIVELDSSVSPFEAAKTSRQFLRDHGI
jgi:sugar phosphate isomerase/epimerase